MMQLVKTQGGISDSELEGHLRLLETSVKQWERKELAVYFLSELNALKKMLDIAARETMPVISSNTAATDFDPTDNLAPEGGQFVVIPKASESYQLEVCLFGGLEASINGKPLNDWPGAKVKLLFIYLLLHRNKPTPKVQLMETFWPELSPESARNNLNVTICRLRKYLANATNNQGVLNFELDCYQLSPQLEVNSDVETFEQCCKDIQKHHRRREFTAEIIAMHRVVDIYTGMLLADEPYEDWLQPLKQKYQSDFLHVVERLREHYVAKADFQSAIDLCRRALEADSLDEESLKCLMYCLNESGKRHQAVQSYDDYRRRLSAELKLFPGQKAREMFVAIQSGGAPDYVARLSA